MDTTINDWLASLSEAVPSIASVIADSSNAYDRLFGPVEEPGGVGPTIANEPKPLPQAAAVLPVAPGNTGLLVVVGIVAAMLLLR
jgi:hypothetical protein